MKCRFLGAALALTLSVSACNNPGAKETASQVMRNTVLGMDTSLAIVQELAISVASNPAIPVEQKRRSYDITHAAAMSLATLTEYVTAGQDVPESAMADAQSKLLAAKTLVNSLNDGAKGDTHE